MAAPRLCPRPTVTRVRSALLSLFLWGRGPVCGRGAPAGAPGSQRREPRTDWPRAAELLLISTSFLLPLLLEKENHLVSAITSGCPFLFKQRQTHVVVVEAGRGLLHRAVAGAGLGVTTAAQTAPPGLPDPAGGTCPPRPTSRGATSRPLGLPARLLMPGLGQGVSGRTGGNLIPCVRISSFVNLTRLHTSWLCPPARGRPRPPPSPHIGSCA